MAEDKSDEYGVGEAPHEDEVDKAIEGTVIEPAPGKMTETAQALIDAAVDLGLPEGVVNFTDGHFLVPSKVADHADIPEADVEHDAQAATYDGMKVGDLRDEVARRNKDRDEDTQVKPDGTTKADLIAALTADDNLSTPGQ